MRPVVTGAGAYAALAILPLLALLAIAADYYPFFSDDAFISLRYAERLIEGKGLTWTDGERVEGYSNLLWVLLVAVPGSFGADLLIAARAICLLSTLAAMAALVFFAWKQKAPPMVMLAALCFFAMTRPVAVWSVGGLESTLHMALITWAVVLGWLQFGERTLHASVPLALLLGCIAINRPDGIAFLLAVSVLCILLSYRRPAIPGQRREAWMIMFIALVFPAAQLLFRIAYYGDILPNTFYAKVALNNARFFIGWLYVLRGSEMLLPLLAALAMMALLAWKSIRLWLAPALFFLLPAGMWAGMVIVGAGDIFPGYRHFVPVIGLLHLLLLVVMRHAHAYARHTALLVALCWLIPYGILPAREDRMHAVHLETWEWDCKITGERLRETFWETQPLVAVTAAGAIPFYSQLPSLDMLALNDRHIAHNPPPGFGYGARSHDLFDAEYLLNRKPDIMVFHCGNKWPHPKLKDNPRFMNEYRVMPFNERHIWVRTDSGKLKNVPGFNLPER